MSVYKIERYIARNIEISIAIAINVVISTFAFSADGLVMLFAVDSESLNNPWQFFTAPFTHANFIHLVLNMIIVYQIGSEALVNLGSKLKCLILFALPVLMSATMFAFNSDLGATVGFSGVSFALITIYSVKNKSVMVSNVILFILTHLIAYIADMNISVLSHCLGVAYGAVIYKYLIK